MKIIGNDKNTIIKNVKDFNIEQTLECGQCFNFDKISENEYVIVAEGKLLHIKQKDNDLIFKGINESEVGFWLNYLDLYRNYEEIKSFLLNKESFLQEAVNEKYGVRILNQEFYETLLSFIISQNKNITHIKQIVNNLSVKYGEFIGEVNGKMYYCFPTIDKLSKISVEEFRECKTGFRAPYLFDAVKHLNNGNLNEKELRLMSIDEARTRLIEIKGVGAKIANCVLLFGLGFREAFPIDVWIKRIIEEIYFKQEVPIREIQEMAEKMYGKYGGYAQQYLFYYGREQKIGKITRK